MQYVRSIGGSVSKTWNSINPATLSGAIDVIVVEQEDGSLACSPFHVRFGKFSLLRPYEKKVEFRVNDVKQKFAMKLGEGGEAFFVFETSDDIPEALQTSPVISPATSPQSLDPRRQSSADTLQEPEYLDLNLDKDSGRTSPMPATTDNLDSESFRRQPSDDTITLSTSPSDIPPPVFWASDAKSSAHNRASSEMTLPKIDDLSLIEKKEIIGHGGPRLVSSGRSGSPVVPAPAISLDRRSASPPPLSTPEALHRAKTLSQKLSGSNIPSRVTDSGDLMLDMTGYKSSEENALRAEVVARKILSDELEGNYDIGALIGADEQGNLWIYSSEEAKDAATQRFALPGLRNNTTTDDAASDPGYQSEDDRFSGAALTESGHLRTKSDPSPPAVSNEANPPDSAVGSSVNETHNYAKTLRLTSDQLKKLDLKYGPNAMSFCVNRSVCQAYMYFWKHDVPIVISDIDGTITKSDALGHVLNMIGRDWTHLGVAKLYTDIVANGYHMLYLTSRSVGQADTTRAYLNGVTQDGYKLPKGPTILSPDRTIAALRREIYLRRPEVFKMACLDDILALFGQKRSTFYAGFGNRLTDALSYRSVNIPSTRIFTINSNAEVSLDLLTLNTYRSSYVTMRELVDQFFPPISTLVVGGGERFTDFNYWRESPMDIEDLMSDSDDDSDRDKKDALNSDEEDEEDEDLSDVYDSADDVDDEYDYEGESLRDSYESLREEPDRNT